MSLFAVQQRTKMLLLRQPDRRRVVDLLLNHGGEAVDLPRIDEDEQKLLARHVPISADDVLIHVRPGRPGQCHFNSGVLWELNPERLALWTGYALENDLWVQHSWCWDNFEDELVETTHPRDFYVGFEMTSEEAMAFFWENSV